MNREQAAAKLYSLALFSPGFEGATATNILLRAERILAGDVVSELGERRKLAAELAGLRDNLAQRQQLLQQVHDALVPNELTNARKRARLKPHERCGHSACSQHYIDTGRSECVEPTHRQARGSRIAREQRDAENRGDPSESPGR